MIHLGFGNCAWGTDPIDGGVQLNFQDKESGIVATVPFSGESLEALVAEIANKGLTDEQKRKLAPLFQSGVILPGPEDFEAGPQG